MTTQSLCFAYLDALAAAGETMTFDTVGAALMYEFGLDRQHAATLLARWQDIYLP